MPATGVKPYWIRVGPGGLCTGRGQAQSTTATKAALVSWFVDPTDDAIRAFDEVNLGNANLCSVPTGIEGYALIPGDWPEPKDGPPYEHLVPFFPSPTVCDPGKIDAKAWRYVVGDNEDPWDVAQKFGMAYKDWVQLRQANWDDTDGFARPAPDAGICSFMSWYPGKRVKIPATWPDPPEGHALWKSIWSPSAGQVGRSRGKEQMKTHKIGPADSVVGLAKRYGVPRNSLFAANPQMHVRTDRDGFRNFSQADFRPGKEINIPSAQASGGSVGAPDDGTVGCGTYGMDQFGGVGAQAQRPQVQRPSNVHRLSNVHDGSVPTQPMLEGSTFPTLGWETTHPTGAYSNEAFWTAKIHEALATMRKAGSSYDLAPLAQRVAQDPATDAKLVNWLRTWSGPMAFISDTIPAYSGMQYATFVWNSDRTGDVAKVGAARYLERACASVGSGWIYDPFKGECAKAMQGGYDGDSVVVGGQTVPYGVGAPTQDDGTVGWNRRPWGRHPQQPQRPQRPISHPFATSLQRPMMFQRGFGAAQVSNPGWNGVMFPFTNESHAQFWARKMLESWPSGYPQPYNTGALVLWLQSVFTGGPGSMIQWVFNSAYHMEPPVAWPNSYAAPAHAADARAVAKQLALNYAFSGGAVNGPNGSVGCGYGGGGYGYGNGGGGPCSYTPAPNWSQNALDPTGRLQTMSPNWGTTETIEDVENAEDPLEVFARVYGVRVGQVGATGDTVSCPGGMTPREDVRYVLQSDDYGPAYVSQKFGLPNSRRGELTQANTGWPQCVSDSGGMPMIAPWQTGTKVRVPLAWFGTAEEYWKPEAYAGLRMKDPQTGEWTAPYVKNSMPQQVCPPGTTYDAATQACVTTPGPGPGPVPSCGTNEVYLPVANICVPPGGVAPVNGLCPTGTMLDGDSGMCVIPGGGTKVDVKDNAADGGWPLWLWGLIGAGAAGGILLVASAASKKGKKGTAVPKPVKGSSKRLPAASSRTSRSRPVSRRRPTSSRRSTRPTEIIDTEGVVVR